MSVTDPTLLPSPQRGALWRWPLGTALPLVLLTLGLVPPLIGSAQPSDSMPFGQQLCDVALFAATAAFVVNLLLLNPITPVSTWRPLGHLVLALWPLALLVIAATAIAYAFGFVLVILLAMLHFAKFVAVLPDTSKTLLLYGAALCVGLLIARAFGAILFFEQRGAFALQGSLARRWRFAHHWGFFTYPVLALSADSGLGRDPLLVSLAVCGAAVPHIVLTAWAFAGGNKIEIGFRWRLAAVSVAIWALVAVAWMPYHSKWELAFLWPGDAVSNMTHDIVWDLWQVPDRDGKITFREREFVFRAPPSQVALVVRYIGEGETSVELSVDRREFGSQESPGKPRLTCMGSICTDVCANGASCPDVAEGWYRVIVFPRSQGWGTDRHQLNMGPQAGSGFRCAEANHAGLELCWDSQRKTPSGPLSDVREVAYPAIKQSTASTWISKKLDAEGHPVFVATCGSGLCERDIEWAGAKLQVTFHARELDDWERFDAGLRAFAERLVQPTKKN